MSTLDTSLNALLASNYAEYGRAVANRTPTYASTAKALQAELGTLKPGTTVSARTDYTVNPQGQLVRSATSVTVTAADDEEGGQGGSSSFTVADERPGSFHDLLKPRPTLEPADEAVLFASNPSNPVLSNAAQDENGNAVEVEILAPGTQPNASITSQRQLSVSHLYARNHDLIYTQEPVLAFAA